MFVTERMSERDIEMGKRKILGLRETQLSAKELCCKWKVY